MTSLEQLKKEPLFFYTDVRIAPSGQGSSMRVFTNLRAYADLGFNIEVVFLGKEEEPITIPEYPGSNIKIHRYSKTVQKSSCFKRAAFYLSLPKSTVLDSMFPIRTALKPIIQRNIQKHPHAIHHFEYDHFASAAAAFKGINAVWSHHDILSERIPLLRNMRSEFKKLSGHDLYRYTRLKRVRQAEDWIANHCQLILNIAQHEHTEFRQNRQYSQAVLFPMSWPDEEAPTRQRRWMADGILRMLHLGSIDGFIGYDSLRFILEHVFPLIPDHDLECLELWVVGKIGETQYSQRIQALAQRYPQVKLFGFVDHLKQVYAEVDVQLVGGLRATGLRTRIIESMVYQIPVLSTTEMAKGLHGLVKGENILLAENAQDFARQITKMLTNPQQLPKIALAADQTYTQLYSRQVASEILQQFLEKSF